MAYTWPDGSKNHTISWAQHQANLAAKSSPPPQKGRTLDEAGIPYYTDAQGVHANSIPTPQAPDPAFEAAKLTAGRNVALGNAESAYQTGQVKTGYGYAADGSIDASNPYSQAMQLQDSYKRSQLGTNNSMAAQGQFYSGARLNAQATNDRNYAQSDYSLRQGYGQALHGIQYGQAQNYANNATGVSDADFAALLRAIGG